MSNFQTLEIKMFSFNTGVLAAVTDSLLLRFKKQYVKNQMYITIYTYVTFYFILRFNLSDKPNLKQINTQRTITIGTQK